MSSSQEVMYASVLLDEGIDRPLDYRIPYELKDLCKPGVRVSVPVRGREKRGTIFTLKNTSEVANVHNIAKLLSEKPILSPQLFALAEWMSRYYCTPLSKVLKGMLPPGIRKNVKTRRQLFVSSLISRPELLKLCEELRTKKPQQALLLDILLQHPKGILLTELLEKAQVSESPLKTLMKNKILHTESMSVNESPIDDQEVLSVKSKKLRQEQQEALDSVTSSIKEGISQVHLLYGVTGSGKTEVYLQAMDFALSQGKGVIFLVPEILLTSQTLERIRGRFKEKVALFHHRLSDGERHACWKEIQEGKARIVMGARSALFAPISNLGLIIVDEEHESSYKQQEEHPCYHARDIALMRAKLENAVVILGSATPSLESFYKALQGKFRLSKLLTRAETCVTLVDMKREFEKAKGFTLFSQALLDAIQKKRSLGEQTILLLNRRGYHTSCLCTACGYSAKCPHCDLSLTYHLGEKILACHLCDFRTPTWHACPKCHTQDTLKYKGAGTEMVERALHAVFPEVRTLRLDADTTQHKGSHELIFRKFRSGKADVLIGTQMVAKGLHLPSVTLVGILNADSSLNIPDFRAAEKTFQLLTQVSGRAGRAEFAGEVIIQTHMPEQTTICHASQGNYEAFFQEELEVRKLFQFPPFCKLAKVVFSGESETETLKKAKEFRDLLIPELPPTFQIQPVVPCGHPKMHGRFRFQFLIKGPQNSFLSQKIQQIQKKFLNQKIRILIDIDPEMTFF
jgi:primosomal protein N' (replication factor Y)